MRRIAKFHKVSFEQFQSAYEGVERGLVEKIYENIKLPKALFAFNDIIALGAIKAMNEKGIKIPEDVSIVGFDDIPFSDMINPPMTTVRVDVERLGKVSINRLIEKIEEEDGGKLKVQISTDIVERKSVI